MKYVLDTPRTIGDLDNQITIDSIELASISFNFDPLFTDQGKAIISIVLVHRASGWKHNIVFNDAASLAQWVNLDGANNTITKAVFNRLEQAGKIPPGTLQ